MKKFTAFLAIFFGTGVAGAVIAFLGGLAWGFAWKGQLFGFGAFAGAILGIILGYPIGVIIGVVLTRFVFHYPGSLWLGIAGAVFGAIVPLAIGEALKLPNDFLFVTYFVATPLLGTIGYLRGFKK